MADNIPVNPAIANGRVPVATSEESSGIHFPQYILMGRNSAGGLEEIGCLNGAIDIHDADVHTELVNKLMRQETATTTTLTQH